MTKPSSSRKADMADRAGTANGLTAPVSSLGESLTSSAATTSDRTTISARRRNLVRGSVGCPDGKSTGIMTTSSQAI